MWLNQKKNMETRWLLLFMLFHIFRYFFKQLWVFCVQVAQK